MAAKGAAMTDTITAQFTLTKDEMAEGIASASSALLRPWQRRTSAFVLVVVALFAGAGGVGLCIAAYQGMGWGMPPVYLAPLVFLIVGGLALVYPGMSLDWMSTRALDFEDPTGTHMKIDANGLHIWTTHEDRRLEWPAVHSLTLGKTAIFLSITGAAFVLPSRCLADPKATFAQLQAWHGVAA